VIKKNLNPVWATHDIPVQLLCNGDWAAPMVVQVWDWCVGIIDVSSHRDAQVLVSLCGVAALRSSCDGRCGLSSLATGLCDSSADARVLISAVMSLEC